MLGSIEMIISVVLTLGLTALAIYARFRFLPCLMAGVMWFALALLVLDINILLFLCCLGVGFYFLARSIVQ